MTRSFTRSNICGPMKRHKMQEKIQMVHCKQINADQMEEDHDLEHQSVVNVFFHVIQILIHHFAGVRIRAPQHVDAIAGR